MYIVDEKITNLINSHYSPLNKDLGDLRDRCFESNIPIILKETESFLNFLLRLMKPKNILEIGTAWGYSASYFATLIRDSFVNTIEIDHNMVEISKENFEKLGLEDKVKVFQGDASSVLDVLRYPGCDNSDHYHYDMVFIDAAKSKYKEFFDKSLKLCSSGSLIICDNVLLKGSIADNRFDAKRRHRTNIKRMNEFIEYIYSRSDITTSLLSIGDGLLISVVD